MISTEVQTYLDGVNAKMRKVCEALHSSLVELGCDAYVKTIYIGYDIDGVMTAAAYAHLDHVEIALALADDHPDVRLEDASHLTWRTLPVCLQLKSVTEARAAVALLREACERVSSQTHDVHRDNDYFIGRKRRGPNRPDSKKRAR